MGDSESDKMNDVEKAPANGGSCQSVQDSPSSGDEEAAIATKPPSTADQGGNDQQDIVTWNGRDDKDNPQTWSFARKCVITANWMYGCMTSAIASSIFSSANEAIVEEFGTRPIVATLGISLFLVGYMLAPPIWGPVSERLGRKWPMVLGMAGFTIFCVPVAVAGNIETILVGRFLQSMFGSVSMALAGGAMVDIWPPIQRRLAIVGFVGAVFGTPVLGPVIGGYIVSSHLGWRWTQWISCIMGASCTASFLVFVPETLGAMILRSRAARMRKEGHENARSAFDGPHGGIMGIVRVYLVRPFVLLGTEPILVLVTVYQSFIYGILYMVFTSYPYAFRAVRHWSLGVSSLPFLGLLAGVLLGAGIIVIHTRRELDQATKKGTNDVIPERLLPMAIFGGCVVPVGLFIYAWTSDPSIHWAGMVIGSVPVGMGMYMVFSLTLSYLVDVYAPIANSALAAMTFVRSAFGAGFPLFAPYMYRSLGVAWATSTLGFISIAMIPIPVLFYRYGSLIRSWSRNSISAQ